MATPKKHAKVSAGKTSGKKPEQKHTAVMGVPLATLAAAISFPIVEAMRELLAVRPPQAGPGAYQDVENLKAQSSGTVAPGASCDGAAALKQLENPALRRHLRELSEVLFAELGDLEATLNENLAPDSDTKNSASERPHPSSQVGGELMGTIETLGYCMARVRNLRARFQG